MSSLEDFFGGRK
ncbi:hypothetical protein QN277_018576 [Acacia crassicarpa]|uniref:Uncharacterized protein n=1 Tax=Acacia crassicarpa TaxID=499986 RepID=A0AAE1JRH5_9FABA|nr:hypothetical protein QN277_018576 [Acacia crassicarpa]